MDADWEMQEQLERERWTLLMEALDAAADGKATSEQMAFIARECGLTNYQPRGVQHGQSR